MTPEQNKILGEWLKKKSGPLDEAMWGLFQEVTQQLLCTERALANFQGDDVLTEQEFQEFKKVLIGKNKCHQGEPSSGLNKNYLGLNIPDHEAQILARAKQSATDVNIAKSDNGFTSKITGEGSLAEMMVGIGLASEMEKAGREIGDSEIEQEKGGSKE